MPCGLRFSQSKKVFHNVVQILNALAKTDFIPIFRIFHRKNKDFSTFHVYNSVEKHRKRNEPT